MSNHRWCCCDQAIDCCEMQSCSNFVTPTQINIQYSGVITRTYSTGQSVVIADYTWNINSNSAFTMRGNNCTGDAPREFGCPTAMLDYGYNLYAWSPEINPQTDNDPLPWNCSSCDAGMQCDWSGQHVFGGQSTWYGLPRVVTGANTVFEDGCCQPRQVIGESVPVLRLSCCDICGCARPTIMYTPSTTLWYTVDDLNDEYQTNVCVNPTASPTFVTQPGTWYFLPFQMSGQCGCPDGATWNSPPGPFVDSPLCLGPPVVPGCPGPDCKNFPQNVVVNVDGATYSWTCELIISSQVVTFCDETVTYTDTCQHAFTIVVA